MFNRLKFFLKYKSLTERNENRYKLNVGVSQYNIGMRYVQEGLDLNLLFDFFKDPSKVEFDGNEHKIKSLFKQIGTHDLLTHIASGAIVPRWHKWNADKRHIYCEDLSDSIENVMDYSGFFLSKIGMRLPNLGTCLTQIIPKITWIQKASQCLARLLQNGKGRFSTLIKKKKKLKKV